MADSQGQRGCGEGAAGTGIHAGVQTELFGDSCAAGRTRRDGTGAGRQAPQTAARESEAGPRAPAAGISWAFLGLLEALVVARHQPRRPSACGSSTDLASDVRLARAVSVTLSQGAVRGDAALQERAAVAPAGAPDDVMELPRRDLLAALDRALAGHAHSLTSGERHVIRALQAAPCQAQSLYARLLPRQPRLFWLDELAYAEVEDPAAAADALQRAGLAWSAARIASPRRLAESSTVDQLRAACRAHGLRVSGRRSELIDRCAQPECARTLRRPGLELRHRTLFRSLMRLATLDHRGDLGRVVQARLGLFKPASYHPTGGAGLFPTRAAWRRYEQGLRLRALPVPPPSDQLFEWLETVPPPPPWRRRYSGRRFAETALRERLRTDERQCAAADSAASWKRMLDARPDAPGPVVARLALALGRAGRPSEAVALCDSWLPRLPPAEADAVERTARRLGRAAGRSHRPLVPLIQAPRRRLLLEPGTGRARRPRWRVGRHHYTVEVAVVETLSRHGRLAVRGEGVPWATLFGVCFRDVLFAPVPGMLPSPMLRAPLDLGTPGFRGRRESMIDRRLREIRSGDASHLIADVVARRGMEDIRGVDWKRFPPPTLIALARLVPGPALAAILEAFVDDWRGARRGLPDLCVLPGRPVRISRSRPGRLGAGLLLVEVKGPGDGLRPAQRVWLDRLIRAGVPAEVWEVRPDMGHGLPRVTADGTSPSRKEHA